MSSEPPDGNPSQLDLDQFQDSPDDHGLSLEELSESFAQLIGEGSDPYRDEHGPEATDEGEQEEATGDVIESVDSTAEDSCPVCPRTIFEAMLFVGHVENEPLTSQYVSSLMRGVRPEEVDELVKELNDEYRQNGCPYEIISDGPGYRLVLRAEFAVLRDRFYGRIRETRLSQSAIDVLAIVAYHQPVNRQRVDELRQKPSGGILAQLVRRRLLEVKRTEETPRQTWYHTAPRFLELFGIESLDELPRTQEMDKTPS